MTDISVITMSHGRTWMLEEAVHCYQLQRRCFSGSSELLIVNDMPGQTLHCSAPGVRIINVPARFHSHNQKTDYAVSQALGEYICIQDDDDIFLPHRLQQQFDALQVIDARMLHMPWAWYTHLRGSTWEIEDLCGASLFRCGAMFERSLYIEAGGCCDDTGHNDQVAMSRMRERCEPVQWVTYPHRDWEEREKRALAASEAFYVYRWGGVCAHLSAHLDKVDSEAAFSEQVMRDPRFVTGDVEIVPRWHQDYVSMVDNWRNTCKRK